MITILVLGILLPFTLLKGKDGSPLLSFSDMKLPESDISLPDAVPGSADVSLIYQWTDGEDNIQFSNTPPPQGVEYTVKGYDPNLNVIQAVELPGDIPEEELETDSNEKITSAGDIGNPYSPEKIEKLIDDANNIEKLLNQRVKNQEALLDQ